MTAPPDDTDLHAAIAALRAERDTGLAREAALAEALATRDAALAQRNSEYGERMEHQAATIDVLKTMSASPGDPQPVFDLIVERACACCGAELAALTLLDGDLLRLNATSGMTAARTQEFAAAYPLPVSQAFAGGRAILMCDTVQVPDTQVDPGFAQRGVNAWHRSVLAVPLLCAGTAIGAIGLGRSTPGAYSAAQVDLLKTFAEQAVIAITSAATYRELQSRTAVLTQRNSEYGERIEHQSATIDVLKAMSASPGDTQPVFDLIVRRAVELCNAQSGGLFQYDGEQVHIGTIHGLYEHEGKLLQVQSLHGTEPDIAPASLAAYLRQFPMPPKRGSVSMRAILDCQIMHIRDMREEVNLLEDVRRLGHRSQVSLPLLRDARAIGVITIAAHEPGGFSESQIALLETFAEQAVIAITSAETYRALQTRTADFQESLEYQTATSDVLKVISRSTFDLQPVLDTLVETAARLCDAEMAMIFRRNGAMVKLAASFGFPPEYEAFRTTRGEFPYDPSRLTTGDRAMAERRPVHIDDIAAVPGYPEMIVRLSGQRTTLGIPLLHQGEAIGTIVLARQRVVPFTDRQIELVSTFADQAVIAIENTRLITEQQEALEQQTATAEVLQVINASPGNLMPVFDAMLEKAMRLCGAAFGSLYTYDGEQFHSAAQRGVPAAYAAYRASNPPTLRWGGILTQMIETKRPIHTLDTMAGEGYLAGRPDARALADLGGARTNLIVPLLKEETFLGYISIYRQEVRAFSDKQIALLQNFAAQAVIAMDNARLITEQREALEQQTATAEVLQVINASPGNLVPVFEAILEKAMHLCEAGFGELLTYDGTRFNTAATRGLPEAFAQYRKSNLAAVPRPGSFGARVLDSNEFVHILDLKSEQTYEAGDPNRRAIVDLGGARTALIVPLRKDDVVLGFIIVYRQEVRLFSEKQVDLLQSFGTQAVIAMENARLLDEIRQRQEELRVTFENMGDGVAMFDESQCLVAWNRNFQDILDVPDEAIAERLTFDEYIRYLAERGEFGRDADPNEQVRRLHATRGQAAVFERTRPNGRIIEVRRNPVPSGGFVLIFSDITDRKRSEAEIRAARDAAEEASRTIEAAFRDLKAAQANLIQAEKMASLGQLTAGIAHEIKNPLNFVNNFAALSVDLLAELKETAAPGFAVLTDDQRVEIEDVSAMLTSNLEKITEHGKRADGIVKAMLEHSRGSSAERRMLDLNVLIDEALNLAYHGARAQDQSFNITLERDFGEGIAPIEVNPQDMTRVFLNIFSNGFYAATRRARNGGDAGFVPMLKVTTRDAGEVVEIRVRDNGTGIPAEIRDKLFQPFFTTKPTGEGTGLGLSITYDIVTKQHGGTITVDSEVDGFTEFVISLPRNL